MRGNAAWGSPTFRAMTWRKWELVQDLLLQVRPARLQQLQRGTSNDKSPSCGCLYPLSPLAEKPPTVQ